MPKYYEFKVAGYYLYFHHFVLLNVYMRMQAIKNLRKLVPRNFL
jgi:hypothetical protein